MAYSAQANLEQRIGVSTLADLTNDTANATTADATVVAALIAKADAMIDAKAGQVYEVPFTSVPDEIKSLSADLACYFAFQRRSSEIAIPKSWETTYKEATDALEAISNQERKLNASPVTASAEAEIVSPTKLVDFTTTDSNMSFF